MRTWGGGNGTKPWICYPDLLRSRWRHAEIKPSGAEDTNLQRMSEKVKEVNGREVEDREITL